MKPILPLLLTILLCPLTVHADEPIAIEASGSLVWHQASKTYRAVGDATATRGNLTVRADELVAHYTVTKGKNDIQSLEAKGNVQIQQSGNTASGPTANYDLVSGEMVITGAGLKLSSAKGDVLTAEEQITFNDKTGTAHAVGMPSITRGDRTLRAQRMDGVFVRDAENNWALQTATAQDSVTVTAKDSIATGSQGTYDAAKNTALLTGNVKIARGQNQMNGDRAEINLATGEARLLPAMGTNPATGAKPRVRALLYQSK